MRQTIDFAIFTFAVVALFLVSNGGAATIHYEYDAAGRLVRVDYGEGNGISYSYDADGNLTSRTPLQNRRRAIRTASLREVPANDAVVHSIAERQPAFSLERPEAPTDHGTPFLSRSLSHAFGLHGRGGHLGHFVVLERPRRLGSGSPQILQ